jgi:transposase-like protein
MGTRKRFTPEEKAKILREIVEDGKKELLVMLDFGEDLNF